MSDAKQGNERTTSILTYIVAVVAAVVMAGVVWNQLYQGVDAEKAAALEAQKEAERMIKDGTYKYPPKFRPQNASMNAQASPSTTSESAEDKDSSAAKDPSSQETDKTEKPHE